MRRILQRVRTLGLARGLRGVEQNPETSYVLAGALQAYPRATAVHVIRDGRDVVCSLLERGWLRTDRAASRTMRSSPTARMRASGSSPSGAPSSSRRARCAVPRGRGVVTSPPRKPCPSARSSCATKRSSPIPTRRPIVSPVHSTADPAPLRRAFAEVRDRSVGRWKRDLTPEQLAEVESEAGALLAELGYT